MPLSRLIAWTQQNLGAAQTAQSVYPAGIDVAADADEGIDVLVVAIDPGRLAVADSELPEAQLIEHISGDDPALLVIILSRRSWSLPSTPRQLDDNAAVRQATGKTVAASLQAQGPFGYTVSALERQGASKL